jgi:hypothetical protein
MQDALLVIAIFVLQIICLKVLMWLGADDMLMLQQQQLALAPWFF